MKDYLATLIPFIVFACSSSEGVTGGTQDKDGGSGGASGAGGADAGGATCLPGGTWTVIDDYAHQGANQTNPEELLVTPRGSVYTTGIAVQMGVVSGVIRTNGTGAAFSNLSVYDGLGGDFAIEPDGTMFASGVHANARVVQRSKDSGTTWQTVDSVTLAAGACNTGWVEIDSDGIVYAAGSCDVEGWRVKRSANQGDVWNDVGSLYQLEAGVAARMADLLVDSADHVFVSGTADTASSGAHWIVRKLQSGGTFATVDDYQLEAGQSASNPTLSAGKRVYATGVATTSTGPHWIVRRADAAGDAWSTIDDFSYPNATDSTARAVAEGPNSILVTAGSVTDSAGVTRVVTRRSTDDGGTWTVTDEWTYSPGKSSGSGPIASDARGNVYGLVRGVASDDHAHWILRKLDCVTR